jgi:hypothetical protein
MRPLALVLLAACADAPAPPDVVVRAKRDNCQTSSGCGENGAVVEGSDISWLRLDGVPYNGVRFLHFATSQANMDSGVFADNLDVAGNRLRYGDATVWHYGADLVNTVIRIRKTNPADPAAPAVRYDITITEVHSDLSYWTQVPSLDHPESYRFQWSKVAEDGSHGDRGELCPYTSPDPLGPWHGRSFNAVVFEGEKYDNVTHDITSTAVEPTYDVAFNIACIGSLPAKQAMSRRISATGDVAYTTTIADDRQNLARAWAAEYCGGGSSFTHQGHALRIADRRGWLSQVMVGWTGAQEALSSFHVEAVWKNRKAVCLETPRMAIDDENVPADDGIWDRIREVCGAATPPRCSDQSWFPTRWTDHGDFMTATIGDQVVDEPQWR